MNNILIIEQRGTKSTYGFVENVDDITDELLKKSVIKAIETDNNDYEDIILTINGSEKECTILKVTHWLEHGDVICEYTRG